MIERALDRWASLAQRPNNFLPTANVRVSLRFGTNLQPLGIFLPNAAPTGMQAALRGKRIVGAIDDGNAIC